MGLSPTIRRSILLLIGSARNTSAAFMAASVYSNVLTFDPSETMPPSTTAIDPRAASRIDPNRPSIVTSGTSTPSAIAALETRMIIRHHSETVASSSSSLRSVKSRRSARPRPSDSRSEFAERYRVSLLVTTECSRYAALRPCAARASSSSASISAFLIRAISASDILTSGGRTTARGSLPSSTRASFMRLCMSTKGSA